MKSMTGMGRTQGVALESAFRIEIKSVNHRFCEVSVRLPGRLAALEIPIQNLIKNTVARGKIDVLIFEEKQAQASTAEKQAFEAYYSYLKNIQAQAKIPGEIEMRDLLPNVNSWIQKDTNTDTLWPHLKTLVENALEDLISMRTKEGQNLKTNIQNHLKNLESFAEFITENKLNTEKLLQERLQEKIQTKIQDKDTLDPHRLHSEVVFYLDRMDITEELQRLSSHLKQAQNFLNKEEAIGRKFDFLIQEFNREFNTIASKCQNSEIAYKVVEAKSEIEKIREQIQNVE